MTLAITNTAANAAIAFDPLWQIIDHPIGRNFLASEPRQGGTDAGDMDDAHPTGAVCFDFPTGDQARKAVVDPGHGRFKDASNVALRRHGFADMLGDEVEDGGVNGCVRHSRPPDHAGSAKDRQPAENGQSRDDGHAVARGHAAACAERSFGGVHGSWRSNTAMSVAFICRMLG